MSHLYQGVVDSAQHPVEDPGRKDDQDKVRFDLVPPRPFLELAKVITLGAKKYSEWNWRKIGQERYVAALYRHIIAWQMGEDRDPETGLEHLAHAMCNLVFLMELPQQ